MSVVLHSAGQLTDTANRVITGIVNINKLYYIVVSLSQGAPLVANGVILEIYDQTMQRINSLFISNSSSDSGGIADNGKYLIINFDNAFVLVNYDLTIIESGHSITDLPAANFSVLGYDGRNYLFVRFQNTTLYIVDAGLSVVVRSITITDITSTISFFNAVGIFFDGKAYWILYTPNYRNVNTNYRLGVINIETGVIHVSFSMGQSTTVAGTRAKEQNSYDGNENITADSTGTVYRQKIV